MGRSDDCLLNDRGKKIARLFKRAKDPRWRVAIKGPRGWSERVATRSKPQSLRYMHELVEEIKEKEAGRLDPFAEHRARSISEHVEDYMNHLRNLERSYVHIHNTESRINRIIKECGFKNLDDIDSVKVENCLRRWRDEEGLGIGTSNHYTRAIKMFELFLLNHGRIPRKKLGILKPLRNTEPRRQRRALQDEEVERLLQTARTSAQTVHGMTGPERALVYSFAVVTALRAGEIAALRTNDFYHEGDSLFVNVRAKISKNSKGAVIPIRSDVAEAMAPILAEVPEGSIVWPGTWAANGASMLRADLEAGKIAYRDEYGRYADFHALRHTAITGWVQAGLNPATVQKLARHSTINMTMNFYTHLRAIDLSRDVESTLKRTVQTNNIRTAG